MRRHSMQMIHARHRQRGVALITALLIVMLATVAAVAIAAQQAYDIRRSGNLFETDQAYVYALGAEQLAKEGLKLDAQETQTDDLTELWAQPIGGPLDDGSLITAGMQDLQGRFNLNNLAATSPEDRLAYTQQLQRLLRVLQIEPDLANAVLDWVDPDQNTTLPGGAEDLDYLNLDKHPYRAANRMMASPSELRMIKGFEDPEIYRKLAPFVTTLPAVTPINVNTASAVVLQALDDRITPALAEGLTRILPPTDDEDSTVEPLEPYASQEDFYSQLKSQLKLGNEDQLTIIGYDVASAHFLLNVNAAIGDTTLTLHSVLVRNTNAVGVMLRSLGNYNG